MSRTNSETHHLLQSTIGLGSLGQLSKTDVTRLPSIATCQCPGTCAPLRPADEHYGNIEFHFEIEGFPQFIVSTHMYCVDLVSLYSCFAFLHLVVALSRSQPDSLSPSAVYTSLDSARRINARVDR